MSTWSSASEFSQESSGFRNLSRIGTIGDGPPQWGVGRDPGGEPLWAETPLPEQMEVRGDIHQGLVCDERPGRIVELAELGLAQFRTVETLTGLIDVNSRDFKHPVRGGM